MTQADKMRGVTKNQVPNLADGTLKALCDYIRAIFSKLMSHVTQPHPLD